jgi:hypothetical protein
MNRHVAAVVLIMAASSACGGRVSPATPGSVTEPRASWRISAGTEFGSEKEVCRSDRSQPCVIAASASGTPTHATVSVYLYPAAGEQTTYRGAFLSSFLGGRGHETPVDYPIKPGERGSFVTSSGVVTSVPGEYEFRMALFANVAGRSDPHQFQQSIPVRVTQPKGSS